MSKHAQLFAILNKIGKTKEEAVHEFTEGRTTKLGDLSEGEYNILMYRLKQLNPIPPGDPQRKKFFAIATKMKWGRNKEQRRTMIDDWLKKQKYGKELMGLTVDQLNKMLYIFEHKVYADYLTALNK